MPEPITVVMVGVGGGGILIEIARHWYKDVFKGVLDKIGASIALVVFTPVMLCCAVLIKLADPVGPVMFRQVRVGLNGRLFSLYKLRTMYVDAEAHGRAVRADQDDARVIPVCRWMRRSHVDELPQLVNILWGDMSLVGPRPERPELFEEVQRQVPRFEERLGMKPGLTGLAQVRNGYDVDLDTVRNKFRFDREYLNKVSLGLDCRLILATVSKFNDRSSR